MPAPPSTARCRPEPGTRSTTARSPTGSFPAADAFAPEFVIVSAGFDAHAADPLAQVRLSTECFGWMTARIVEIAEKHSGGRILSLLEGGYNVEVLPKCVATHLEVLAHIDTS